MTGDGRHNPTGAGRSSFDLIDSKAFFEALDLQPGISFLDVGCGNGSYCLGAADIIGPTGTIYAIDMWAEGIQLLEKQASERNIHNIKAFSGDAGRQIPIDSHSVDVCLMATALHDFVHDNVAEGVLQETVRVIKPQGRLAVMEFKKIEGPPGPSKAMRMSPQEVEDCLSGYGFHKDWVADVGPYNYLMQFRK